MYILYVSRSLNNIPQPDKVHQMYTFLRTLLPDDGCFIIDKPKHVVLLILTYNTKNAAMAILSSTSCVFISQRDVIPTDVISFATSGPDMVFTTHTHLAPRLKKEYSHTYTLPLGFRNLFLGERELTLPLPCGNCIRQHVFCSIVGGNGILASRVNNRTGFSLNLRVSQRERESVCKRERARESLETYHAKWLRFKVTLLSFILAQIYQQLYA